jgi:hypothetical protein
MPREHSDRILEGKELLANALEKQLSITSREVPTPNPFAEEHVATDDDVLIQEMKAQTARTVPRNMVDAHGRS